jgi:pSer/pThr/pTyr-binding forkhead associated (FHA) protein
MKPPAPGRTATQVFGALAPGKAKLVLEGGDAFDGATYRLNAESVEAGRSKGAIIFPSDPCLAPHHATFFYRGGALHVRDEGAPGGVYLRLRGLSVLLRAGDHFAVGERLLKFAGLLPNAPTPPPDGTRRLGSPRPAQPAVVVEEWLEGGAGGRVFIRSGPAVTIGRAGCAVNLGDDPRLSQSHAEIVVEQDGTARLRDLGSSNGTYVKIPPHGERELRDGDCVRLGHEVLRVAMSAE